jgi:hypothetical protein
MPEVTYMTRSPKNPSQLLPLVRPARPTRYRSKWLISSGQADYYVRRKIVINIIVPGTFYLATL